MTTLRVLLDTAPAADRAADWALYGATGRPVRSGCGRPADWPARDRSEAVVAAGCGRVVSLVLPPLPAARVAAAAAFALEDQLAGAPEESHAAFGAQAADGTVRGVIVDAAWMRAFAAGSTRAGLRWDRIVLEADLARPPSAGWCWCAASTAVPGFVRTHRGASLAVGAAHEAGVPPELALAVSAAADHPPKVVRVDIDGIGADRLARARDETGIDFGAGEPWRWFAAPPEAFANAVDLSAARADAADGAARFDALRLFRPALAIVVVALAIHIVATLEQWLWLAWQTHAARRELVSIARDAVPDAPAGVPPLQAIARRDADLRHRAGQPAEDDLLPLLARAAPALSTLPAGATRSLRYADRHVVLELQRVDAAALSRLQRELQQRGLTAVAAPSAGGARLRLGLD